MTSISGGQNCQIFGLVPKILSASFFDVLRNVFGEVIHFFLYTRDNNSFLLWIYHHTLTLQRLGGVEVTRGYINSHVSARRRKKIRIRGTENFLFVIITILYKKTTSAVTLSVAFSVALTKVYWILVCNQNFEEFLIKSAHFSYFIEQNYGSESAENLDSCPKICPPKISIATTSDGRKHDRKTYYGQVKF